MEEQRIEGLWDCLYCEQKAIKARYQDCPFCGTARGVETIFYLPDDLAAATLTEEEAAKTSNSPDWLCEYCGAYNSSLLENCKGCGAERASSKKDYGILHKLTGKLFGKDNR